MRPIGATTSTLDSVNRWRRVIWSCTADRGVLLYRYYLVNTRGFAIYLHHLMTSDEDRALHDHPWSFLTILLSSGYYEHMPWTPAAMNRRYGIVTPAPHHPVTFRVWRRRFSILWRPAEWQHRLELERPTWTLVVRFRIRRTWGFWTRTGFLDNRTYGREFCD